MAVTIANGTTTATLPSQTFWRDQYAQQARTYEVVQDVNGGSHVFSQALTSGKPVTLEIGTFKRGGYNGFLSNAERLNLMTVYNAGLPCTVTYGATTLTNCQFTALPQIEPIMEYGDTTSDVYTAVIQMITTEA